jgi:hypothetical protein
MALQSSANLLLLKGLLPVSSVFRPFFPVLNFAFINVCFYLVPLPVFGRPLSGLPWGLLLNIWTLSLSISVLVIWPIHCQALNSTSEIISKCTNSCFNSTLYRCLLFSFVVISPHIRLESFLSKAPLCENQGHATTMFWECSLNNATFRKTRSSMSFSLLFVLKKNMEIHLYITLINNVLAVFLKVKEKIHISFFEVLLSALGYRVWRKIF